jgi:transcriptional regulator with XRE-family HTH domain
MNIKQVVGDNIRFIRQKRDLTLDDISILTKMSRTYINDVELAKSAITIVKLETIARALKVEPALLLTKDSYRNIK